jgi:hypothetical protein
LRIATPFLSQSDGKTYRKRSQKAPARAVSMGLRRRHGTHCKRIERLAASAVANPLLRPALSRARVYARGHSGPRRSPCLATISAEIAPHLRCPRPSSRSGARGLRGAGRFALAARSCYPARGTRVHQVPAATAGLALPGPRLPGRESDGRLSGNAKRGPLGGVGRVIAARLGPCARTVIGDECLHDLALPRLELAALFPPDPPWHRPTP